MWKRSDRPVPGKDEMEEGYGKRMLVMTDFDLSNVEVGLSRLPSRSGTLPSLL